MSVISISVPDDLLQAMDAAERGYGRRSAIARTAIRRYLAEAPTPQGHIHGSITLLYPHGKEPVVSDIRHVFHDVVLSLMHTHCEPETCMDVMIVGGPAERVLELQKALETRREIGQAQLVVARV